MDLIILVHQSAKTASIPTEAPVLYIPFYKLYCNLAVNVALKSKSKTSTKPPQHRCCSHTSPNCHSPSSDSTTPASPVTSFTAPPVRATPHPVRDSSESLQERRLRKMLHCLFIYGVFKSRKEFLFLNCLTELCSL